MNSFETGIVSTSLSNTFVSTSPQLKLTGWSSSRVGSFRSYVAATSTSLDGTVWAAVSEAGLPSPVVSKSTTGTSPVPTLAQSAKVLSPNHSQSPELPAPAYCRSPACSLRLVAQPPAWPGRQVGRVPDLPPSCRTDVSDIQPVLPLPCWKPLPDSA